MLHFHDRASFARALTLDLDPALRDLLAQRIGALVTTDYDLTDLTEYVVVEACDSEADIVQVLGFSPLVNPIDGVRFGGTSFCPFWDYLALHGDWYELIVTVGNSGMAYILFIPNSDCVLPDLRCLCRCYTGDAA